MYELKTCECGEPTYSDKCSLCYADDALAQPEQKPVAWPVEEQPDGSVIPVDPSEMTAEQLQRYTTPPQRTWVGLTRAERFEIERAMSKYYDYQHECKTVCLPEFAAAIEAKLKEKNT